MELNFIYINGLNEIDTIHFDSIEDRNKYMSQGQVKTVVTEAFYPPHYHLSIRLDTDDIDLNTTANYLSFEYNDKWYYYFIQSIRYVNENILEFSLKMDTIMTYYFDADKYSGVVERNTIKRWNGDNFNRDYIQENVSVSENFINGNVRKPLSGERLTLDIIQAFPGNTTYIKTNDNNLTLPYCLVPRFRCDGKNVVNVKWRNTTIHQSAVWELYDDVNAIKVISSIPSTFLNINYSATYNETSDDYDIAILDIPSITFMQATINTKNYWTIFSIDYTTLASSRILHTIKTFAKNTDATNKRNYKYCPYLSTPSYYRIIYGEKDNFNIIQTQKYNTDYIDIHYLYNVLDGSRLYYINSIDNPYSEILTCYSSTTLPIATDNWKQYYANHQYSAYIGLALSSASTMLGAMSVNPAKMIGGAIGTANQIATIQDIKHSPAKIQSSNDVLTTLLCDNNQPYIITQQVEDINQCMNYFENYGLLINKTINRDNLNNLYNRYYYDYVKFKDVEVDFGCIVSLDLRDNFISRLKNGVRFWHYSSGDNIGVYNNDNVEKSW